MIGINHPKELINRNVLEPDLFNRIEIREHFRKAVKDGESYSIPTIDIRNLAGQNIRANIECVPLKEESGEISDILSIWEDVTELERRAYELSMLRQVSEAMQSVLDIDILLNLIHPSQKMILINLINLIPIM